MFRLLKRLIILIVLIVVGVHVLHLHPHLNLASRLTHAVGVAQRSPTTRKTPCHLTGSDPSCTPKSLEHQPSCRAQIMPIPQQQIRAVWRAYQIRPQQRHHYQIVQLVPQQLGGTMELANLFPINRQRYPNVHDKALVDRTLIRQVCARRETLSSAQQALATSWSTIWDQLPLATLAQAQHLGHHWRGWLN